MWWKKTQQLEATIIITPMYPVKWLSVDGPIVKKRLRIMQVLNPTNQVSVESMVYIITYDNDTTELMYDNGAVGDSKSPNISYRKPTKDEKFLAEMNGIKWVNESWRTNPHE